MSTRSGLKTIIAKFTIPSTGTGVAYTNGGLALTVLDTGRWLIQCSYAIFPNTAGQSISSVSYGITTVAVLGGVGAVGLIQHVQSATTGANIVNKCSNMGVITITADNTPIFLSITGTTTAGNYQGSLAAGDVNATALSFVKIE